MSQKSFRLIPADYFHILFYNVPIIILITVLVHRSLGLFLLGYSMWDLGWHQAQHHRDRRFLHIPLRTIGCILIVIGVHLMRKMLHAG